jgi:hypothetical protein
MFMAAATRVCSNILIWRESLIDKLWKQNALIGIFAVAVLLAIIGWAGSWFDGEATNENMAPPAATTTEQPTAPAVPAMNSPVTTTQQLPTFRGWFCKQMRIMGWKMSLHS